MADALQLLFKQRNIMLVWFFLDMRKKKFSNIMNGLFLAEVINFDMGVLLLQINFHIQLLNTINVNIFNVFF